MNIDKGIYGYIVHELSALDKHKRELELLRMQILEGSPLPADGQPKGNQTGNPTEHKATQLITSEGIMQLERSIKAVEQALIMVDDKGRDVYREVFAKGRRDNHKICIDICISYSALKRRKKQLIELTGKYLGVIR